MRNHGRVPVRRVVAALAAVAGLLVGGATLAWACTAQAHITLSPPSGPSGETITVYGGSFVDDGPVEIRWDGSGGPLLARATGPNFAVSVTIPDVPADVYTIVAYGYDSRGYVQGSPSESFEVTAGSSSSSTGDQEGTTTSEDSDSSTATASASGDSSGQGSDSTADTASATASGSASGDTSGSGDGQQAEPGTGTESQSSTTTTSQSEQEGTGSSQPAGTTAVEDDSRDGAAEPAPAPASATQEASQQPTTSAGSQTDSTPVEDRAAAESAASSTSAPAAETADPAGARAPDAGLRDAPTLAEADAARDPRPGTSTQVSSRAAGSDLWSGFGASETPSLVPALGTDQPVDPGSSPLTAALALFGAGLLTLFAGFGTAAVRRRRVRARA